MLVKNITESKGDKMQQNVGINSENLKKLILDITDYRDKISGILNDTMVLADSIKNCYATKDGEEFRIKFDNFSSTFSEFLKNIESYGTDLDFVLTQFKQNDAQSVDIFKK